MSKNTELHAVLAARLQEVERVIALKEMRGDEEVVTVMKGIKHFLTEVPEEGVDIENLKLFVLNNIKRLHSSWGGGDRFIIATEIAQIVPELERADLDYDKQERLFAQMDRRIEEAVNVKMDEVSQQHQLDLAAARAEAEAEKDRIHNAETAKLEGKVQSKKDRIHDLEVQLQQAQQEAMQLRAEAKAAERAHLAEVSAAEARASEAATMKVTRESNAVFGDSMRRLSMTVEQMERRQSIGGGASSSTSFGLSSRRASVKPAKSSQAKEKARKAIASYFSEEKMVMIDFLVQCVEDKVESKLAAQILTKILSKPFATVDQYFNGELDSIKDIYFKDKLSEFMAISVDSDQERATVGATIGDDLQASAKAPEHCVEWYVVTACCNNKGFLPESKSLKSKLAARRAELKESEVDFPQAAPAIPSI